MKKSYELLDLDQDGKISEDDLVKSEKVMDITNKFEKFENQTRMSWVALLGILILTFILFLPFIDVARLTIISEFISMLYISLSGIVATYMGVSAWVYQKNKDANSN
jgi:uncharacterized membrane protein